MSHQTVIVLDFGGQYNQLIARRVRECGVYCEVKPYTTPLADIRAMNPIGIIFTGGPNSVYDPKSPQVDPAIFTWGVPRTTPPGSTARPRRISIRPASSSRAFPPRASPG